MIDENNKRYVQDNPSLIAPIENLIDILRRRWLTIKLSKLALLWIALFLTISTVIIFLSAMLMPENFLRWIMIAVWLLSISLGPAAIIYLIITQPNNLVLAELAEKRCNLKHNYLINALQLARENRFPAKLIHRLLAESAQAAENIDPKIIVPIREIKAPAILACSVLLFSALAFIVADKQAKAGISALIHSRANHTSSNTTSSLSVTENKIALPNSLPVYISAHYPKYLHQTDKQLSNVPAPVIIPEGTKLSFRVRTIANLTKLSFQTENVAPKPFVYDKSTGLFSFDYIPLADTKYAILAQFGTKLLRYPSAPDKYWPIKIIKDAPPIIRIDEPAENISLPPNSNLKVIVTAQDDYNITEIKIMMRVSDKSPKIIFITNPDKNKYSVTEYIRIPSKAMLGDVIEYWAQATDNRNLPDAPPQTSVSKHYKINIISPKQYNNSLNRAKTSLIAELLKITKLQIHLKTQTLSLSKHTTQTTLYNRNLQIRAVITGQIQIEAMLEKLLNPQYPAELTEIINTIKTLTEGPVHNAIVIAKMLTDDIAKAKSLIEIQRQIILTLQSIIEMLTESSVNNSNSSASKPADNIDTSQALEKLSNLLKEFAKQQRLVIKASESLADKSPDDFSQNDKAKLDQLTQLQEQWDKFLNQAVNDMNKLADQDFSASVLRDELIEIQSQVQISEQAMKKQAIHLAISAEQIGLELAEQLTHNLERWLANEPDRKQWELEEPPNPIDVPLAELPEELEDIVGELIEQEEDFYDEIEDATSSWADSLDKGAGWDVSDGPISDYSAKGITGNLLPNANEIAGRSGEGRTGRASGEFVEKSALGKGGRRTPTRLTKDAFQSGQIEDLSKDAPGGATGGGKLSGAGAEGLTGNTPQAPNPNLGALKHKQAVLLTKAKLAYIQAQKHNWGNFQLDKIIALMSRNIVDMDKHAYRSILARKTIILNSLRTSKTLISSKFKLDSPAIKIPKLLKAETQTIDENEISPETRSLIEKYYEELSAIK